MATVKVQFGGRQGEPFELDTNADLVAVRTHDKAPVAATRLSSRSRKVIDKLELVRQFPEAGVEVFRVRSGKRQDRDLARATLKEEPAIRFAGRVLSDPVFKPTRATTRADLAEETLKDPVLYSENLFIKFDPSEKSSAAREELAARGLKVKREIEYIPNGFFAAAPEGTGLKVFGVALDLLQKGKGVQFCHPELLRTRQFKRAFPRQWHLKSMRLGGALIKAHASVVQAWRHSKGSGIVIAVIDTGIDIDHEEFSSTGKIVSAHDATSGATDVHDPRPRLRGVDEEEHGTCVAGVACANGRRGASGVAPAARLMPIRLMSALGSQDDADAIAYAADNGADVISCSWGPEDGVWWKPRDPAHRHLARLPDSMHLAITHALMHGRGGKGCVICWAAGNGNESVDKDMYASCPGVMAIAACNDTGKRSVYSDTGNALWCAFPSDDSDLEAIARLPKPPPIGGVWTVDHPKPKTPGIWTTDWSGKGGYNKGGAHADGDKAGNYAADFGGTSSAAPGVAGVAALVLALNKRLRYTEVQDILKNACDKIDRRNGQYDPVTGHSPLYGYGRLNAATAVRLAMASRGRRRS